MNDVIIDASIPVAVREGGTKFMIKKEKKYLADLDTDDLDIEFMNVTDATKFTNS